MAFDPEQVGGFLPEEHLAVAIAMADRAARDQIVMDSIAAQITGVPHIERSPEELRATHLGQSALLLLQVEDPSRSLTLEALAAASSSDARYERDAEIAGLMRLSHADDPEHDDPLPVEASDVQKISGALVDKVQSSTNLNEILTEDFAAQLASSKRIAAEHGVRLETVYTDDDLYYEAYRTAFTPQEEARKMRVLMDTISGDMLTNIAVELMDTLVPAEIRDQIPPEELEASIIEIQLDPGIQAAIAAQADSMREPLRQRFLYGFIKTYGYEAVGQLSDDDRENLLPKMRLATELAELIPPPKS